jgi:DNA-directed RNA polymerase subunit RPC12/RpoP
MSAIAYKFKCATCGKEFEAPEVPEMSYGLFVMRTEETDEAAFLDALNDSAFLESYEFVKDHAQLANHTDIDRGRIQQAVFSSVCDKTARGETLRIGLRPKCRSCGSRNMASWQQRMPIKEWPLPTVTHDCWEEKTATEKRAAIDDGIQQVLKGNAPF